MSLSFVGGATGSIAVAGTTLTVTYTPTTGNKVIAGIRFSATVSGLTCKDQGAHALASLVNPGNFRMFQGNAVAGATSYVFVWTTAVTASAFVAEYSGVVTTNGTTGTSASGSGTALSRTVTTTKQNSFLVAGFGQAVSTTFTAGTGNLRLSTNDTVATSVALVDNTSASASPVTDSCTAAASAAWISIAWEISPTQPAAGSSISKTVILTDDNGFYPIGTFGQAPTGTFQGQPTAMCSTDTKGFNATTFVGGPQVVKSVTTTSGTYTDGNGNEVTAPQPVAQTDPTGTSLWSSTYIGTPVAMNLN